MTEKKEKDPMHEKSASIEIKLSADSGYRSTDSARISPHQWSLINRIIHAGDADAYDLLAWESGLKPDGEFYPGQFEDEQGNKFQLTKYGFKPKTNE